MARMTRYNNNIGFQGLTEEAQNKIKNSKVVVMGIGGLGSSVVMNLCALGVGNIKIVDDGIVHEENLNHQLIHKYKNIGRAKVMSAKETIQDFNSDIKVDLDKILLNELNYFNVISGFDVIVDCFNDINASYMLNEIAIRHKKPLIYGAVRGYYGQITTILPPETGCLNCVMQKSTNKQEENYASLSPVYSIIAGLQSQEVIKLITGEDEPLFNRMLIYDGKKSAFREVEYSKNIACDSCNDKNV